MIKKIMSTRWKFFLNAACALTFGAGLALTAVAQTPSAAQIEQFKRLPPAQQRALAAQMGINLDDYAGMLGDGESRPKPTTEPVTGKRTLPSKEDDMNKRPRGNGDDLEELAEKGTDRLSLLEDNSPEATQEKLTLFGYDIFNLDPEAFQPATSMPVPAAYVLGPGDTLVIQLYGKESATHSLTLDREGRIQFPKIGPVSLAGMNYTQASNKISEIVSEQMIGIRASTTMGALRTIRVFVLGEVLIPGSYVVGSLSTMTNAIFSSGGISKIGSLRKVQLKRQGKLISELDLYDLLLKGDTSKDARLLPGDVIFVPPIGKTVGVAGEVKRPALYELKGEKTVGELLKLAGGLLPTAYLPASRIERITSEGEKTLVNLDASTEKGKRFRIHDADIIQIFSTLDTMRDIVKLEGHVKRPGGFAWRPSMHFTDVVKSVDAMLPNPDIAIGLIVREEKSTRKIFVRHFSPRLAFENPKGVHDPVLESRDTIQIFDFETDRVELLEEIVARLNTQANFAEMNQTIQILGSVRFPGLYPLSRDMNTTDIINLAGGLTETALGFSGEITRYQLDEQRRRLVNHLNIDLTGEPVPIVAGDTITVKKIPMWHDKEVVQLIGEVLHPGTYTILPGETLMDVLERAGGLTPHAYPEGAVFSREDLRVLEEERLERLKDQIESDLAAEKLMDDKQSSNDEADSIIENLESVRPLGRMVIDLPAIIGRPGDYDFQLADGDALTIPRYKPSVTVVGEVQYPTSHFYDHKLNAFDYVERSGGTKQNADKKRIYIVKANGAVFLPSNSAWFRLRAKSIEPGDTIIVPLDTDKMDKITLWSSVTQIMSNAAVGISAINTLSN